MPARLYVYDTVFERLAQDLEHMTAKLGQFIQEEDAVVGQRHLAWHRHVSPADQPGIRDSMMGGAKRASRHQRGAVAGEAGDTMDACGLNGFGQSQRRQDGGESPCQPRRASPRRAKEAEVTVNIPTSPAVSRVMLQRCAARTPGLAVLVSATPVTAYGTGLMYSRWV
jgi:hypothetical protein